MRSTPLDVSNIEYVLWAILIGLVISNTMTIPKLFQSGIDTYEFWLKLGIVLLGSRFVLADVLKLGGISLGLVVIEITLSLALMTFWTTVQTQAEAYVACWRLDPPSVAYPPSSPRRAPSMRTMRIPRLRSLRSWHWERSLCSRSGHCALSAMNDVSYGLWAGWGSTIRPKQPLPGRCIRMLRARLPCLPKRLGMPCWICCSGVRDLLGWKRPGEAVDNKARSCGRSFRSLSSAFC